MKCECENPPCKCTQKVRDHICEQNESIPCGKVGILREDCNSFWEGKKVLCDEHYKVNFDQADRKCGKCGSSMRSCVC